VRNQLYLSANVVCRAYAEQTEMLTRMRGMLEDENTDKRARMMKELQEENKRLAKEKRDRENSWR
jgi:hypothetical protein